MNVTAAGVVTSGSGTPPESEWNEANHDCSLRMCQFATTGLDWAVSRWMFLRLSWC